MLDIGILGTGAMAAALGRWWALAGHRVTVGGRSPEKAGALARAIGSGAASTDLRRAARHRDVVLLAVSWAGVADTLQAVGGGEGTLTGDTVIDCTNAVEHGVGRLLPEISDSAAHHVAALARGSHVVKAFNILPATTWQTTTSSPVSPAPVVALAGDDPASIEKVSRLVRDAHGFPVLIGPLTRARQVEEAAGFVIALAFAGHDPAAAVPALR